jgi:NAD dependent epimerase/dehydratase family
MIVGSGLMASAFAPVYSTARETWIYAAGVSNSFCADEREFVRERRRLETALADAGPDSTVVYFGTCSVLDPELAESAYVRHKLAMESLVQARRRHLILRLPQVAGRSSNPHTLLNYLHSRVSRSERFVVWKHARRHVVDVADVVAIARARLDAGPVADTMHIAPEPGHPVTEIVAAFEKLTGKRALYDEVDRGSAFVVDASPIAHLIAAAGVDFGGDYLYRTLRRYYA